MESLLFMVFQLVLLLFLIPLFDGIARKLRAKHQSRIGPPITQTYRDFVKLYQRERTLPYHTTPIYRYTPYILFSIICTMYCLLPISYANTPLTSSISDVLVFIYLGGAFRFFFAVASVDSGDVYAGIGASRELMMGIFVEATLILSLVVIMLEADTTSIPLIKELVKDTRIGYSTPSFAIASVSFLWVMYVESGRKPYDIAEAEQELDEGLLAEYSGRDLAFMQASLMIKQFVMIGFFLMLFEPWNFSNPILATIVVILESGVLYVGATYIDNFTSRYKITSSLKTSALIALSIALGAVFLYIIGA